MENTSLIFVLSSNLVLATETTKSTSCFVLKSIEFGRFMTSEGTETLILAFTSKTKQSVAYNRQRIFFIWIFLSENGYIKAFYTINFRLQSSRLHEIELKKGKFCFFHRSLAPLNQHHCSAMLIYGTTFPGST